MKPIINVGIGGKSFVIEEDAYGKLKRYFEAFKGNVSSAGKNEVMNDLEERVAELLAEKTTQYKDVVDMAMVNAIIKQMGMPDGEEFDDSFEANFRRGASRFAEGVENAANEVFGKSEKRLFRKPHSGGLGGVCSGLSAYFNVDTTIIRLIFILLFIFGCSGLLIYIILWIIVPKAKSPVDMCMMYGLPVTPENIERFSRENF